MSPPDIGHDPFLIENDQTGEVLQLCQRESEADQVSNSEIAIFLDFFFAKLQKNNFEETRKNIENLRFFIQNFHFYWISKPQILRYTIFSFFFSDSTLQIFMKLPQSGLSETRIMLNVEAPKRIQIILACSPKILKLRVLEARCRCSIVYPSNFSRKKIL